MIENKKGHIVNICSVAHVFPGINLAEYSASKGALYNYFYSLRLELKKDNLPINTTIINPHVINTGMFKGFTMKLASYFF